MKKKPPESTFAPVSDFENGLARLEEVVKALESSSGGSGGAGDLPLEKAVALYREGLYLSADCKERLTNARNELLRLTDKGLVPLSESEVAEQD